ncbi:MAG: right-handed parallel beta-helix repeat-containing protein [Planctomycetota bacterium]
MSVLNRRTITALFCVTNVFFGCGAADFYVATTGSDSNPGTEAQPFRTVQKGCDAASGGSTIYVKVGVYSERVTITKSGNASDGFVTLRNFATDAVALDGVGLSAPEGSSAMLTITDKSYVRVQGFEIRNYSTTTQNNVIEGIFISGSGEHIEVLNCHVHHIANNAAVNAAKLGRDALGIAIYGTNAATPLSSLLFDGVEVDHCTLGSSESFSFNGNIDGFTVTRCTVHDNDNIGIDAIGWEKTAKKNDQARNGVIRDNVVYNINSKGNPAYGNESSAGGIYVDGGRDILIERNHIYHTDYGIEIGCEHRGKTSSGVIVRENLIHDCTVAGLGFGGYDLQRGTTLNCQFLNNTFFNNDSSNSYTGEINVQVSKNNQFKNNIVFASAQNVLITNPFAKAKSLGNVFDYNLYFCASGAAASNWNWNKKDYSGFDAYRLGSKQDAHSKFADPLFVSVTAPVDLRFQTGSPAMDAGDPSFVLGVGETDFAGNPRKNGTAVDVGAYEK